MKKASITATKNRPSALLELERSGLAKRPRTHAAKVKLSGPIPKASGGASVVEASLAEREAQR